MSFQSLYQQKKMRPADAIRVVKNGDTIVVPTAVGEPPALLTALSEARRDFRDVQISQILAVPRVRAVPKAGLTTSPRIFPRCPP